MTGFPYGCRMLGLDYRVSQKKPSLENDDCGGFCHPKVMITRFGGDWCGGLSASVLEEVDELLLRSDVELCINVFGVGFGRTL